MTVEHSRDRRAELLPALTALREELEGLSAEEVAGLASAQPGETRTQLQRLGIAWELQGGWTWECRGIRRSVDKRMVEYLVACDNDNSPPEASGAEPLARA